MAHLTSTPATRSPEWRLSVTLYQLPTCHRHPLCFTPLCVLSLCSHLCLLFSLRVASLLPLLPPCPPSLFSFPVSTLLPPLRFSWFQIALFKTLLLLLLSVPFSPHPTPYPCFSFLVLVSQLDSIGVCALAPSGQSHREGGQDCGVGEEVQGFHFLLEQNMPVGPAGINWKCNLGLWVDTQGGVEVWCREQGPYLCGGTPERMLPGLSGDAKLPPWALLQTWTPWGENWSQWASMRRANSEHGAL